MSERSRTTGEENTEVDDASTEEGQLLERGEVVGGWQLELQSRDAQLDRGGACEARQHEIPASLFSPYLCRFLSPLLLHRSVLYNCREKKK
jgi:hypothetical protein